MVYREPRGNLESQKERIIVFDKRLFELTTSSSIMMDSFLFDLQRWLFCFDLQRSLYALTGEKQQQNLKWKINVQTPEHQNCQIYGKTRRKRVKRLHSGTTSDKLILKFYEKLVIWVSYFIFGIFTCKYFTLIPKCYKTSNYFTMLPKHF